MILELDRPYNPGDADPGKTYSHLRVQVTTYDALGKVLLLVCTYGVLDSSKGFTPGSASPTRSVMIRHEDLAQLQGKMANEGEPALVATMRLSYQALMERLGLSGTLRDEAPAASDDDGGADNG